VRSSYTLAVSLLTIGLFAGACSGDGGSLAAFCEIHTDPELEGLDPSDLGDADKLSLAMASMEKTAPAEIKADVTTTADGYEAARSGEVANLDVEEFQAAAARVEEFAEDNCTLG
jgi:hypothetical protein